MIKIFVFSLSLFAAYATWASEIPKQGDVIQGAYRVYASTILGEELLHTVPLPKGEWVVIGIFDSFSRPVPHANTMRKDGLVPMRELLLAKVSPSKTLEAAIYIKANSENKRISWVDEFCIGKEPKALYVNNYDTVLHDQRCTTIQTSSYLQKQTERTNFIRSFFDERGIRFESGMIMVQNTEYDSTGKYLRFDTYYFPTTYGLDNPGVDQSASSPWTKANISKDKKLLSFIKGLEAWSNENSSLLQVYFIDPKREPKQIELYSGKATW